MAILHCYIIEDVGEDECTVFDGYQPKMNNTMNGVME